VANQTPKPEGAGSGKPDDALARVQKDLHLSAYSGSLRGVRHALEQGANVDAWEEQTGLTALHLAVGTNNLALVKFLLEEAGAKLMPDKSGRWPTVIAAECCASEELCDYIVEREAKVLES
jgi:hypothetical protein